MTNCGVLCQFSIHHEKKILPRLVHASQSSRGILQQAAELGIVSRQVPQFPAPLMKQRNGHLRGIKSHTGHVNQVCAK